MIQVDQFRRMVRLDKSYLIPFRNRKRETFKTRPPAFDQLPPPFQTVPTWLWSSPDQTGEYPTLRESRETHGREPGFSARNTYRRNGPERFRPILPLR